MESSSLVPVRSACRAASAGSSPRRPELWEGNTSGWSKHGFAVESRGCTGVSLVSHSLLELLAELAGETGVCRTAAVAEALQDRDPGIFNRPGCSEFGRLVRRANKDGALIEQTSDGELIRIKKHEAAPTIVPSINGCVSKPLSIDEAVSTPRRKFKCTTRSPQGLSIAQSVDMAVSSAVRRAARRRDDSGHLPPSYLKYESLLDVIAAHCDEDGEIFMVEASNALHAYDYACWKARPDLKKVVQECKEDGYPIEWLEGPVLFQDSIIQLRLPRLELTKLRRSLRPRQVKAHIRAQMLRARHSV